MHRELVDIVLAMERDLVDANVPAGQPAAPLKPHFPRPLPASPEEIRVKANAAKVVKSFDHGISVLVVAHPPGPASLLHTQQVALSDGICQLRRTLQTFSNLIKLLIMIRS